MALGALAFSAAADSLRCLHINTGSGCDAVALVGFPPAPSQRTVWHSHHGCWQHPTATHPASSSIFVFSGPLASPEWHDADCRPVGGRALRSLHGFSSLQALKVHSLRPHLTTGHLDGMLRHLTALTELDLKAQVRVSCRLRCIGRATCQVYMRKHSA